MTDYVVEANFLNHNLRLDIIRSCIYNMTYRSIASDGPYMLITNEEDLPLTMILVYYMIALYGIIH